MKKLLFTAAFVVAGAVLPTVPLHADALSILQNTRIKSEQIISVNNLSNIYVAATNYLAGNRKYPAITELNVPVRILANPYHGLGAQQQVPDKITDATSAYAYFGAALNGTGAAGVAASTPLAFEKPSIRPDGKVAVLFLDGKTEIVNAKAKNCAEVVAALKKEVEGPKADVWAALEKAAAAIDAAK